MSSHTRRKRLTVPQLVAMKGQQKIVSLTAYTCSMAQLMDPFVGFILIGDSTAMVGYGRTSARTSWAWAANRCRASSNPMRMSAR